MGVPLHVALVPGDVQADLSEMAQVASALSRQALRDFGPLWGVSATVDAFPRPADVPVGYWPIYLVRNPPQGAAGIHLNGLRQPYALVEYGNHWSITASHELLEMLADPFGSLTRPGNVLAQARELGYPDRRVQYLVEVCDPCEGGQFAYTVNGVWVSDFYTPNYFDPVTASGVRYSFTGAISSPLTVLNGGYISWVDTIVMNNVGINQAFQLRMFPDQFSNAPHILNLSEQTNFDALLAKECLRAASDRVTKAPDLTAGMTEEARNNPAASHLENRTAIANTYLEDMKRVLSGG